MHGKVVQFSLILMPHCGPGHVPLLLHPQFANRLTGLACARTVAPSDSARVCAAAVRHGDSIEWVQHWQQSARKGSVRKFARTRTHKPDACVLVTHRRSRCRRSRRMVSARLRRATRRAFCGTRWRQMHVSRCGCLWSPLTAAPRRLAASPPYTCASDFFSA
jgi:hypothetical protein